MQCRYVVELAAVAARSVMHLDAVPTRPERSREMRATELSSLPVHSARFDRLSEGALFIHLLAVLVVSDPKATREGVA